MNRLESLRSGSELTGWVLTRTRNPLKKVCIVHYIIALLNGMTISLFQLLLFYVNKTIKIVFHHLPTIFKTKINFIVIQFNWFM